jgi:hypothetical protein
MTERTTVGLGGVGLGLGGVGLGLGLGGVGMTAGNCVDCGSSNGLNDSKLKLLPLEYVVCGL